MAKAFLIMLTVRFTMENGQEVKNMAMEDILMLMARSMKETEWKESSMAKVKLPNQMELSSKVSGSITKLTLNK